MTLLLALFTAQTAWAQTQSFPTASGGDGTEGSPYLIATTADLDALAADVNSGTAYSGTYFRMTADIDYAHTTDWYDATSTENNYTPIGNRVNNLTDYPFSGTFDGDGHTVSGIRIYRGGSGWGNGFLGLFGYVEDGTVKNVTVADARITGELNCGGIAGSVNAFEGTCTVENCHVLSDVAIHAVVDGAGSHGGIAGGSNGATISGCTSAVTLTAAAGLSECGAFGGIVGDIVEGTMSHCLAVGVSIPVAYVDSYGYGSGAITGYIDNCSMEYNSYANCNVGGTTTNIGGPQGDITTYINPDPDYPPQNPDGAIPLNLGGDHIVTAGRGVTATGTKLYTDAPYYRYAAGDPVPLGYNGTPPTGYKPGYAVTQADGTAVSMTGDATFTMPAADVTVTAALRSTGEPVTVAYINADGTTGEANAIALDGHEAVDGDGDVCLDAGTYYVGTDIAYANQIRPDGDVTLILADGKTMEINSSGEAIMGADDLNIYGQALGTGSLTATGSSSVGIRADGFITINGGTVTVTATGDVGIRSVDGVTINGGTVNATGIMADGNVTINGGKVTTTDDPGFLSNNGDIILGWTTASDFIYASSYVGTVKVAEGKAFTDGSGHFYSGTLSAEDIEAIAEQTLLPVIALADNADNTSVIAANTGSGKNVMLAGRTLYKDGSWNTLCLPFDVTVSGSVLDGTGVEVKTLTSSAFEDGTLTMSFSTTSETTLTAGTPYIIRWTKPEDYEDTPSAYDLVNPVFTGVTVSSTAAATETAGSDYVDFIGIYSPTVIYEESKEKHNLYLGTENKLYYPTTAGITVNAFRGYFRLKNGLIAGEDASGVRAFALNFGDETTGIISVHDSGFTVNGSDAWYTLDGRKLNGKPTRRGLYIHNGIKVVIK